MITSWKLWWKRPEGLFLLVALVCWLVGLWGDARLAKEDVLKVPRHVYFGVMMAKVWPILLLPMGVIYILIGRVLAKPLLGWLHAIMTIGAILGGTLLEIHLNRQVEIQGYITYLWDYSPWQKRLGYLFVLGQVMFLVNLIWGVVLKLKSRRRVTV